MKFFVAICIIAAALYSAQADMTPERKAEVKTMRTKCMETSGATMEMIHDIQDAKYLDNEHMPKYMLCMFEKIGMMDHDGTMHKAMIMEWLMNKVTEDEAKTMMHMCMDKMKDMTNVEKKAYEMFKCCRDEAGKPLAE